MIPSTSPFSMPMWPMQKTDGSWRMTVDYHKFKHMLIPLAAAIPAVTSLFKQIHTSASIWYAAIGLGNVFSPYLFVKTTSAAFFQLAKPAVQQRLPYLRDRSVLQPYIIIWSSRHPIAFLFRKTSHWSIPLMMLRQLVLVSGKDSLF